jgi:DNA-binding MarR family transcriptional regulator
MPIISANHAAYRPNDGECNCTALRKASRRLSQMYDAALSPAGFNSTQYAILVEIERHADSPLSMGSLASALVMDRSTLGHNVRPLIRDKVLTLRAGTTDRRSKSVALTSLGRKRLATARTHWLGAQQQFETVYGDRNASLLRQELLSIARDERFAPLATTEHNHGV